MTSMAMMDRRTLMATLAALALPQASQAATAADYANLKAFIDSYVTTKKLPCAVVAIKRGNDPVQYISGGTLAYDTPLKAGPDSLFRIYSMTKPITGLAIMKLIEDGKLTLDTPLGDILPEFKTMQVFASATGTETRPATKPIKIRHLLTHSAGFGYSILNGRLAALYTKAGIVPGSREIVKAPGADLAPVRDLKTFAERLAKMPLDFEPGTRWQYSVATDLLGYIVQKVSGMSFHDYLRRNFFQPLKMVDTDFMVPKEKLNRFTSVVAVQEGRMIHTDDRKSSPFARDRDLPSGGGGLVSSARDYSRFTSMLLNEGTLDGVRIVKPETVRLAGSNLLEEGVRFGGRNGYGAAVAVVLPGGERPGQEPPGSYWWFGIAGSQMWIDPVNKLSVVLMLQNNPTTYPVQSEVRVAAYKDLATIKA